jgi:hypothetical protein
VKTRSIFWLTCALSVAGCGASPEKPAEPAASITDASPSSPAAPSSAAESQGVSSHSPTVDQADGKLSLDRLIFTVPEGWERKQPSSNFLLAEFNLPKAGGDEADGRLTVSTAGGSIEANLDRWRDQFGRKPEKASEERKTISGLNVSLVDYSGEFDDQRGSFAPATKRSGYRMLAAIIPVEGELHFIKAVGPEATIAAHANRFHQFIVSVVKK